jgi:hypothetical protein
MESGFYYIAGYTSGGAPYGITWKEHEEMKKAATNQQKFINVESAEMF